MPERLIPIFLGVLLLLLPPLLQLWLRPASGWFAPYVLWLLVVVVAARLNRPDDDAL